MLSHGPVKARLLDYVGQLGLVREEEGEVCGEDAGLHGLKYLLVLLGVQRGKNIILFLENIFFIF